MTAAIALRTKLTELLDNFAVFHQHLPASPPPEFAWFIMSDAESEETFDDDDEPDRFYFDLELYGQTLDRLDVLEVMLKPLRNASGMIGDAHVQLIELTGQREDYTPQANAESLPPFYQIWRIVIHGFDANPLT